MSGVTREEFSKIYNEQFLPILEPLEVERAAYKKKAIPFFVLAVIFAVLSVAGFITEKASFILLGLSVSVPCLIYVAVLYGKLREKLKNQIITKILALCGNMYLSGDKDSISYEEVKEMRLFSRFTTKSDDDVIIGIHKGCNFVIEESHLTHTEGSGKSRHTVTDFKGLMIKIKMNKAFSGETFVGEKWKIAKKNGFEEVKLEDVEFMKHMKVFSTDQIEARYLLTTSFIERLYLLGDAFSKSRSRANANTSEGHNVASSVNYKREVKTGLAAWLDSPNLVSAAFAAGYVYLFVPKGEDFFEIDVMSTLFDEKKYYDVYSQIQLILSIIDYLKLDLKLGL